jgi:2-keto-3-deoxy-L-rhamnonate aldolase RhmA
VKSAQILREKIASGQLTLGIIVTMHFWLELIEMARDVGLDYIIIDTEHTAWDDERVSQACAIGRMVDFPILIRPSETRARLVRMAADKGPCGFLLPFVESAATLDDARDGLYMPPRGKRRPGGPGNRWMKDYNYSSWRDGQENQWIVLSQIESVRGLEHADEIARHELTTAMAVGPFDLSANLGVCWEPNHPKLQGAIDTIREAGRRAGKTTWMIGDPTALVKRGFTLLCIAEPSALLETTLRKLAASLRDGAPAVAASTAGEPPLP